jgi:hypothetical protein
LNKLLTTVRRRHTDILATRLASMKSLVDTLAQVDWDTPEGCHRPELRDICLQLKLDLQAARVAVESISKS